jgi:hypothetical protein
MGPTPKSIHFEDLGKILNGLDTYLEALQGPQNSQFEVSAASQSDPSRAQSAVGYSAAKEERPPPEELRAGSEAPARNTKGGPY